MNRTSAPAIALPVDYSFQLPDYQLFTLDNGIPVYSYNQCPEPVLHLELVFPAGLWYEQKTGIANATAALLKNGTARFNAFEINEQFEQYGASVKAAAGNDWASFSLSCMSRHLEKVLPLFASLLDEAVFPQSEIDIYIQNAKQRLSVQLKKCDFVANRLIDTYLFGSTHPYGRYSEATDLEAIHQDDLLNHLKTRYQASGCRIFLAGQFNDTHIQLLNSFLGNRTSSAHAPSVIEHPVLQATEKKYRVAHDATSVQGAIRLLRPFPEKQHPDFSPMILLNTVFGGYFGSRLMSNIREEKGYTYGIHSYLYNYQRLGGFIISTEAGRDVCDATLEEIYTEMKRLREEEIPAEELQLVKNYLLGNLLGELDGAFQIIQRWKNLILNGFSKDRFNDNIRIYKTTGSRELQELANKYLQPSDFYELVVC